MLASGCADPCDFESPCPERFDVALWCYETSQCSAGSMPAACTGTCDLRKGEPLIVPLATIGTEMLDRPNVKIVSGFSAEVVPLGELQVLIDGVSGTHLPTEEANQASLGFAALSDSPMTMEVRYDVGSSDSVLLSILFHDLACETANPAPPCRD
jgi:hypothetical protein